MSQQFGYMLDSAETGRGASNSPHVIGVGPKDGFPLLAFQDSTGSCVEIQNARLGYNAGVIARAIHVF